MKRRILVLLLVAMMIVSGCTTAGIPTQEAAAPAAGAAAGEQVPVSGGKDSLVVAMEVEPSSMDPNSSSLAIDSIYWTACYGTLVRYDEELNEVPYLAESWENIDDTNWRFTLREGIKFSNGSDIMIDDIRASFQAAFDSGARNSFATWWGSIKEEDDRTFILTTSEPAAELIYYMTMIHIIPKSVAEQKDYNYSEAPICSGPYKLLTWSKSNQLTFTANEYFYDPELPKIPNLTIRIMPEGVSRTIALQQGEVDYLVDVQATDTETLEADESVVVLAAANCSPFYMNFNVDSVAGGNENFRKAVSAAINRENASIAATNGYATPLASCSAMGLFGSTDANAQDYDPEKAKELIAASGLSGSDLNVSCVVKEEAFRLALESVQADLQQIGVNMEIRFVDNATYSELANVNDYTMSVGKLVVVSLAWGFSSSFLSDGNYNQCHVREAYIDDLISKCQNTVDADQRKAYIEEFIGYINEKAYRIGIYQMVNLRAYNANLEGIKLGPTGIDWFANIAWKN